jgi:hypothetical protein
VGQTDCRNENINQIIHGYPIAIGSRRFGVLNLADKMAVALMTSAT